MGAAVLKEVDDGDVPTPATGKAALFINTSGDVCVKLDDGSVVVIGSGGFIVDVTAGTGISADPQSAGVIEISNLGVLSLNSLTGVVTLTPGAGITLTPQSGNVIEIASTATGGVESLNGEQGALTLQPGANVTITPQSGGVFVIDATGGGVAAIEPGDGISIHELSGGVKQIAANLQQGSGITITPVSGGALEIAASGAAGVSDVNGLTGSVTLAPGSNITITPQSGNVLSIASSGGGGGGGGMTVHGRLTLTSGTPITTSDVTGATTVYFTPFRGNTLPLWDGGAWDVTTFTETSLALGTITDATNYDVFGYLNTGVLALEMLAWTNNTTRATALALDDGMYVKSGDKTRLYLGTFRTTSTTTTEDSGGGVTTMVGAKRFLWNYYNRVERSLRVIDTTDSWNYANAVIRQANAAGGAGNKVEFVLGVSEEPVQAAVSCSTLVVSQTQHSTVGIGLDTITALSGIYTKIQSALVSTNMVLPLYGEYRDFVSAGYHYLAWNERGSNVGTCTFYGDNGGFVQSGINGALYG